MTTFAQAPGSPPELTSSKSSKSSSFHSSSFSGADGTIPDLAHFEDIGLNDERPASMQDLYGHHGLSAKIPSLRKSSPNGMGQAPNGTAMRELTNGARKPQYPPLQLQSRSASTNGVGLAINLSNGSTAKRGIISPSAPSLAMTAMNNHSRSRSPSPKHLHGGPTSPRSMMIPSQGLRPTPSSAIRRSTSRSGSWQPSRKTAKELEEEYHDSDEDLPDDASLWNVPMSPGLYRSASNAASANASASTSPERASYLNTPVDQGMNKLRPVKTAPVTSQLQPTPVLSRESLPVTPTMAPRASTGMIPDHFAFPKARSKSWTAALFELSEEAQTLSEVLEAHSVESDRLHEARVQNGTSSVRPSMEKSTRSNTNVMELPPLNKGNVMIDPLPISKEKEKVLSRTRPSWLPPKSRKEEKKHLKEYQRMMELSLEAEKKRAAKAASMQCARDDTKATLQRIWEEHVLPNWSQAVREPRTRELWWRGIASRSRAEVWRGAIGNELALTDATYTRALQRARDVLKDIEKSSDEPIRKEKIWFDAIQRDVEVTFPDLKLFQVGRPLHSSLVDILMAYTMYRADVGYSHGTHLSAALLLLTLHTPNQAFTSLANFLNRPLPLAFLTGDRAGMHKTYSLVINLLEAKFPKLHSHLFGKLEDGGLALLPDEIFEPIIRTMFLRNSCSSSSSPSFPSQSPSAHSSIPPSSSSSSSSASSARATAGLPLEHATRIWDVLVFDGDAMVIRACVGILGCLEGSLYGGRDDVLGLLGWEGRGAWRLCGSGSEGAGDGEEVFMGVLRGVGKI